MVKRKENNLRNKSYFQRLNNSRKESDKGKNSDWKIHGKSNYDKKEEEVERIEDSKALLIVFINQIFVAKL